MEATEAGRRVAEAQRICDSGDLDGLAAQWTRHPPALWVALGATAENAQCFDWMLRKRGHDHVIEGIARAATARVLVDGGSTEAGIQLAARRLRAWAPRGSI